MKFIFFIFFLFSFNFIQGQPKTELTLDGFTHVTFSMPVISGEKFIELTKHWAVSFNKNNEGGETTEISGNSVTVHAYRKNAFFYRNKGETFYYKIGYSIRFDFSENDYTASFVVKDIYTDRDVLIQSTLNDYYTSEGIVKEGFEDVKISIETTVNKILQSHYNFIINYK